ncbi:S49 family peptidase [Robbsia andropogonis]|nr:S49 family peptidase [Robbsia andropogonis]
MNVDDNGRTTAEQEPVWRAGGEVVTSTSAGGSTAGGNGGAGHGGSGGSGPRDSGPTGPQGPSGPRGEGWACEALAKAAMAAIREQRAARRWRIFFRFLWLAIVLGVIVGVVRLRGPGKPVVDADAKFTAVVTLSGVIAANTQASSDNINASLNAAFKNPSTAGIVLKINSPGGSPVEAGIIYRNLQRMRKDHPTIPVYAVIGDVGASGAYYVAAAADKIYVDPASIVGSIGVIMEGFGFPGLLEKLGVERRVQTAGVNKAIGDPFSPQTDDQKQRLQVLLDSIHQQFIAAVKNGRGNRLHETPDMFSGAFWNGEQAVQMGLADATGDTGDVARNVFKAPRIRDFTVKDSLADRVARRLGTSLGASMGAAAVGELIDSPNSVR